MADAEASAVAARPRAKGEDPLTAILEVPFKDAGAGQRRLAVLEADDRPLDALTSGFAELDALIDQLYGRLDELLVIESAPPMPVEPDVTEVAADDVIEIEENRGQTAEEAAADEGAEVVPDIRPPTLPSMPAARPKRQKRNTQELVAHQSNLLYEDVIWLLAINDGQGALISLERLIVMSEAGGDVAEFLEVNNKKLLSLYEGFIGPFTKTPKPQKMAPGTDMPEGYKRNEKIAKLMEIIQAGKGKKSIADLIKASPFSALQTCCILNQLRRSALVKI